MTTFGRAVPEGIEWNWREDGFCFTPYDRKDNLGYSQRRINLWIGPRFTGRPLKGEHGGWEWSPIAGEEHRMEPDYYTHSRWWGLPLPFGWEVSVMVSDFE